MTSKRPPGRKLIVTADDVGIHRGMTLGAITAHERGIVTGCSVVPGGADFEAAAELLRHRLSLAVGVHLRLVDGRPLCAAREVPSLVEPGGAFASSWFGFVRRYLAGKVDLAEVEAEFRRQIEAVSAAGLTVSHLNSHQHLHMLPGVFGVVVQLAQEHGIPYMRLSADRGARRVRAARRVMLTCLSLCASLARRRARGVERVRIGDAAIGIAQAGHLTSGLIGALLDHVVGVTELVCHPGVDQGAIARGFDWGYEWQNETDALCSPGLRSAMTAAGIDLVSPAGVGV